MSGSASPRIVVDTNVVFEGLTKQGGASGLIVDTWLAELMVVCVSNAIAYDTLTYCLASSQQNGGVS